MRYFIWKLEFVSNILSMAVDCFGIDDIGNLEDSPRLMFIDEECQKLLVVNGGAKLTRNINQK